MNHELRNSSQRGVSLVEVVIGTAVLLLIFTGLIASYTLFVSSGFTTLRAIQAAYLLEEGIEAAGTLRDYGWTANIAPLSAGTPYYFSWQGNRWITTSASSTIDNTFTRSVVFDPVYRDVSDNIAGSGTMDSGTKKVTVVVRWQNAATTTSRTLSTYLTNLFNN